jgi:hypothetical protein
VALNEITVIDAPWQRLETYLSDETVALELMFNTFSGRWSLAVEIVGVVKVQGRRIVPNTDLFAGYSLNIGRLFLVEWTDSGGSPGRDELPSGQFRLIHDDGRP